MIGVNFQPGASQYGEQNGNARPTGGSGVQEAIRVLSLRLPRVVGAQSAAPMPLLTSQGSGGNSRVDSVVNQVLSRYAPQMQPPMPMQPSMASADGPTFSGDAQTMYQAHPWARKEATSISYGTPRVTVDQPPWQQIGSLLGGIQQEPESPSYTDSYTPPPSMLAPLPDVDVFGSWYNQPPPEREDYAI